MKNWRIYLVAILLSAPVLVFVGCGVWLLWLKGWWWWLWWMLPVCWGAGYLLCRRWRNVWDASFLRLASRPHWTPQDELALGIVREQQQAVRGIDPEHLADPRFYFDMAMELGRRIALHYHPKSRDPISSLTIEELLAAAHLACDDMERWVRDYVPGSHMLTVSQWRAVCKAPDWLRVASNVSWVVSVFLQPLNLARFLASRVAMDSTTRQVQTNLLAWFYVSYVRHVGFYLIEMNSGRLRGGADRYRAWLRQVESPADVATADGDATTGVSTESPLEITIAVVGQVKAGKSSLINALLGERKAATDILPLTQRVQRYSLELDRAKDRLVLLDTAGYGSHGPDDRHQCEMRTAMRDADLILLVMNATNPARQADLDLLRRFAQWYQTQPQLRPPPVLAVLTHIDLLTPAMEWSPPYNWPSVATAKEKSIAEAVAYHGRLLPQQAVGVVPVCVDTSGREKFGVDEHLIPAILAALGESRACALVRTLHAELDTGSVTRLARQLCQAGRELLQLPLVALGYGDPLRGEETRDDSQRRTGNEMKPPP